MDGSDEEPSGDGGPVLVLSRKDRRRQARRSKRKRRVLWTVGVTAGVVLILAASVAGYGYYLVSRIHRIHVKGLTVAAHTGVDAGTENILMVGSTDRCALTVQYTAYGLCDQGVDGVNSDVVMILHLDGATHAVSILSIPRDLFVPNARADGANKIDAALYEGPQQLVAAIQEDFGIPIQDYVELNFETFANVVNALGGVNMYFPEPVYDSYSDLYQPNTGCIHLDGYHALQVVRARHLQYDPPGLDTTDVADWPQEGESDLARIRRDHEFLRVLAAAVAKNGLGDPITDARIIDGIAPQLQTTLSVSQMVDMVLAFHSVDAATAPQYTLPVEVGNFGSYEYEGGDYGDIEFPSEVQDQQVVDEFLGIGPTVDSMTGAPLPAPSTVTVSVVNGSGVYDQAAQTAGALDGLGFQATATGDAQPVGEEAETVVSYDQLDPTVEAAAQAVARSMSGAVIMAYVPPSTTSSTTAPAGGAEVTVTTGTQFAVNPPAPPAPPTTTARAASPTTTVPGTSTTTTTTAPTSGEFSAVSAPVEALQPWDPRSCTASGGEGP